MHQLPPFPINPSNNNPKTTENFNIMDFPQLTSKSKHSSKTSAAAAMSSNEDVNEVFTEAVSESDIEKIKKQKQLQEVQKIYQTMFGHSGLTTTNTITTQPSSISYLSSLNNNNNNNNFNSNSITSKELQIVNNVKRSEATVLLDAAHTRWVETGTVCSTNDHCIQRAVLEIDRYDDIQLN
jgi:hypothetical protein